MMFTKQQVHVLLILWVEKRPVTHKEIERMAVAVKYNDTPQGLRSRMVDLERSGNVYRVDRKGVNSRHRHCWRFALTDNGRKAVEDLFDKTQNIDIMDISYIVGR